MMFHRDMLMEEAEETFKQAEVLIERDVIRTRCTFSDTTSNKTQQNTEPLRYIYTHTHAHMYIYYD